MCIGMRMVWRKMTWTLPTHGYPCVVDKDDLKVMCLFDDSIAPIGSQS